MKKVKIELVGVDSKKLFLYESVEALFESIYTGILPEEDEYCYVISLSEGEYAEAEWLGCEIDHEPNGEFQKYNYVRVAKVLRPKNASGSIVSVYTGWCLNSEIPFVTTIFDGIKFTKICDSESTIDVESVLSSSDKDDIAEDLNADSAELN